MSWPERPAATHRVVDRWRAAAAGRVSQTPDDSIDAFRHPRQLLARSRIPGVVFLLVIAVLGAYLVVIEQFNSAYCTRGGTEQSIPALAQAPSTVLSYVDDGLELRRRSDGQCTGVTDRPGSFLVAPSSRASGDDAAVARLTELITTENDEVDRFRDEGGGIPVRKIVVASMLSSGDDQSTRSLSAGVNELRGALIAQKLWNDQRNDPNPRAHPPFLLSVLLANLGGNSAYAVDTAEQIRALAERDPSILGVTGMGQSRDETLRAVDILGAPGEERPDGLFVMASVLSGDEFTGKRNFYRIAPDNRYQVEQLVRFAERRFPQYQWNLVPDASVGDSGRTDPYSNDLSRGLSGMLRQSTALFPGSVRPYYSGRPTSLVDLANVAADICADSTRSGKPAAIFYTGRANEVSSLLDGLNATVCGSSAVVIGGDDMSQLETTRFAELQKPFDYRSGQLYYAAFGPSDLDRSMLPYDTAGTTLVSKFSDAYDDLTSREPAAFGSPTNGHIDSAFDAVHTTAEVARDAPDPSAASLGCTLKQRGSTPYSGVTGRLRISGDCAQAAGADPATKLLIFQRVVGGPGNRSLQQLEFSGTP